MDPEAFLDLANQVAKIKMYPYFDLAHAVVCCLAIKEDMASGRKQSIYWLRFSKLQKWSSCKKNQTLMCFVIVNFLCNWIVWKSRYLYSFCKRKSAYAHVEVMQSISSIPLILYSFNSLWRWYANIRDSKELTIP